MISSVGAAHLARKKQNESIPPRLLELRKKIQDEAYIDMAIQRIAQVISRRIIESPEDDLIFGKL